MNTVGIIVSVALPAFACGVSAAAWIIRSPWQECVGCHALGRDHLPSCRHCHPLGHLTPAVPTVQLAQGGPVGRVSPDLLADLRQHVAEQMKRR